jgi:hypothetical protein
MVHTGRKSGSCSRQRWTKRQHTALQLDVSKQHISGASVAVWVH